MINKKILLVILGILMIALVSIGNGGPLITYANNHFSLDGQRFRFVGCNISTLWNFSHGEIDDFLDHVVDMKMKSVRVILSTSGQLAPLADVDYMINSARNHDVRLIITFFGGSYARYLHNKYGTDDFGFWRDADCIAEEKAWISEVLNRVNSINGIPYKEDAYIMYWTLGAETPFYNCTGDWQDLKDWLQDMATYVKSIDPGHLLTGGVGYLSGYYGKGGATFDPNIMEDIEEIEVCAYHAYSWPVVGEEKSREVMHTIAQRAHALGYPVVLEEYGIKITRPEVGTMEKKEYWFQFLLDNFYEEGGDGTAFWQFRPDDNFTESEINRENGMSMSPDDAELREIIKKKAEEIE